MNHILLSAMATLFAAGALAAEPPAAPAAAAPTANPLAEEAKSLVKEFAGTLKGELEAAMKAGGPTKAVSICQDRAPAIAKDIATRSGWEVGRVSLKTRNPQLDTPDAWEQQVLTRFDQRQAAGEPVDTMAFAEVVQVDGTKQFRFMKAIPTGEPCLACHGSAITPEVAAALDQAYPEDQARGYAVGDVRGAVSLSKTIE
ncbi:DUF3365 domain-containing protein [uncultured Lamprocystis sp.]|jgi:hypothetical protein|uniref:Tll0287-like domain-containing protein n=1 Tax=uncultured Lamprocystis sp. TaxID=543132 RepID=UPI0025F03187|nr:DUF3365 domain-containing protein [uncultured Lamprocystis sp.]